VYKGGFYLVELGDTYLDLSEYGKGYVWINGHNLGRYWEVGPQRRLFCPGVWLNKGENSVVMLNVYGKAGNEIKGVKDLYDTPIVY
jgi:beta-galactosidase